MYKLLEKVEENILSFISIVMATFTVVFVTLASVEAKADGVVNGGSCYNDWHYLNGTCHEPTNYLALAGFAFVCFVVVMALWRSR